MQVITEKQSEEIQGKTLTFNVALSHFMAFINQYAVEDFKAMEAQRFIQTFSFRCYCDLNPDVLTIITDVLLLFKHPNADRSLAFHYFDEDMAKEQFDWVLMDYNKECKTIVVIFVNGRSKNLTIAMYDNSGLTSIGYRKFDYNQEVENR